jgi:aspartate/methionine/tyrosine aminotransferase
LRFSKRVKNLPPYLFVDVIKKIAAKRARGEEIISFAIGDPDIPTPSHIIDELILQAKNPLITAILSLRGCLNLRRLWPIGTAVDLT